MLHKLLREKRRPPEHVVTINPTMIFGPDGLVLGAGTILLKIDGPRRSQSLQGREMRVLALLSAFHDRPTASSVLRNIERAVKAWSEGDACLAYIHLAHADLHPPQDPWSGAYRMEMAAHAMRCGASPRAVFEALSLSADYIDTLEKA